MAGAVRQTETHRDERVSFIPPPTPVILISKWLNAASNNSNSNQCSQSRTPPNNFYTVLVVHFLFFFSQWRSTKKNGKELNFPLSFSLSSCNCLEAFHDDTCCYLIFFFFLSSNIITLTTFDTLLSLYQHLPVPVVALLPLPLFGGSRLDSFDNLCPLPFIPTPFGDRAVAVAKERRRRCRVLMIIAPILSSSSSSSSCSFSHSLIIIRLCSSAVVVFWLNKLKIEL